MLTGAAVMWRYSCGRKICCQACSHGSRQDISGLPAGFSGFPQNKQSKSVRATKMEVSVFYNLTPEVTHHYFSIFCWSHKPTGEYERGLHQSVNTRRWVSLGTLLEAGCHTHWCTNSQVSTGVKKIYTQTVIIWSPSPLEWLSYCGATVEKNT